MTSPPPSQWLGHSGGEFRPCCVTSNDLTDTTAAARRTADRVLLDVRWRVTRNGQVKPWAVRSRHCGRPRADSKKPVIRFQRLPLFDRGHGEENPPPSFARLSGCQRKPRRGPIPARASWPFHVQYGREESGKGQARIFAPAKHPITPWGIAPMGKRQHIVRAG